MMQDLRGEQRLVVPVCARVRLAGHVGRRQGRNYAGRFHRRT